MFFPKSNDTADACAITGSVPNNSRPASREAPSLDGKHSIVAAAGRDFGLLL
jgi:hypothetical protein